MKFSRELTVALTAAKHAGKILHNCYKKHHQVSYKKGSELVTEVDKRSEKLILQMIKKNFPSHSIYSEEAGKELHYSEYMWVIDPLDGTTNYSILNPFFNVSIALAYQGKPILGVVYNPIQNDLFYAEKGKGAFLNGKPIHVSKKMELTKAVIGFCHGSPLSVLPRAIGFYKKLKLQASKHTRQFGSAALELCYVACGRIDAFEMSDMQAYDVAGGAIIAQEAGARVTDFKGKPFTINSRDILVTNGRLHQDLLKLLQP